MAKVAVIGAGVIGLSIARELADRGREVVVLDMKGPGAGSSWGNAGWITPSLSHPVPEPGLIWTSIKWMFQPDSPLYIRPQLDPDLIKWTIEFFKNCNEKDYHHGFNALLELNRETMASFDRLKAAEVEFDMWETGMLFVAKEEDTLERLATELSELKRLDYTDPQVLDGRELQEYEPMFRSDLAGAVRVPEERHVRPDQLLRGIVNQLNELDVKIERGVKVTGAVKSNGKIDSIETTAGPVSADTFVLATGAWTGRVGKLLGEDLPIQPGKGYSMTIEDSSYLPKSSQYLVEGRIAVTPFHNDLRLAGTMEISGLDAAPRKSRVKAIWKNSLDFFRKPVDGTRARSWAGMRPMSPDGLPVIGLANESDNLYVATGHAMLGVTLGPLTGEIVADLITGEKPSVDLEPFLPSRFD